MVYLIYVDLNNSHVLFYQKIYFYFLIQKMFLDFLQILKLEIKENLLVLIFEMVVLTDFYFFS